MYRHTPLFDDLLVRQFEHHIFVSMFSNKCLVYSKNTFRIWWTSCKILWCKSKKCLIAGCHCTRKPKPSLSLFFQDFFVLIFVVMNNVCRHLMRMWQKLRSQCWVSEGIPLSFVITFHKKDKKNEVIEIKFFNAAPLQLARRGIFLDSFCLFCRSIEQEHSLLAYARRRRWCYLHFYDDFFVSLSLFIHFRIWILFSRTIYLLLLFVSCWESVVAVCCYLLTSLCSPWILISSKKEYIYSLIFIFVHLGWSNQNNYFILLLEIWQKVCLLPKSFDDICNCWEKGERKRTLINRWKNWKKNCIFLLPHNNCWVIPSQNHQVLKVFPTNHIIYFEEFSSQKKISLTHTQFSWLHLSLFVIRYFAAKTYHKTDECLTPLFIRLKFVVIPKSADSLCFDKIPQLFTLLKLIFGFRKLQGAEIYPQFWYFIFKNMKKQKEYCQLQWNMHGLTFKNIQSTESKSYKHIS